MAQSCPGPERLVCGAGQGQLPACAVSAAQSAPGPPQGDCGGRGRPADGGLSHAEARGGISPSLAPSLLTDRANSSPPAPPPKTPGTPLLPPPYTPGPPLIRFF